MCCFVCSKNRGYRKRCNTVSTLMLYRLSCSGVSPDRGATQLWEIKTTKTCCTRDGFKPCGWDVRDVRWDKVSVRVSKDARLHFVLMMRRVCCICFVRFSVSVQPPYRVSNQLAQCPVASLQQKFSNQP